LQAAFLFWGEERMEAMRAFQLAMQRLGRWEGAFDELRRSVFTGVTSSMS
jgi:hypothetical protein